HQSTIDSSFYRDLDVVLKSLHGFDPYGVSIRSTDSLKRALFNLYQQLIQPVESVFKGKSVIIVPHEELAYLPFDALINRYEPETSLNFTAWPCLIHSYDISYLYNTQLIDSESNPGMRLPPLITWVPDYPGSGKGALRNLMGASEEVEEVLKITAGRRIHGNTGKTDARRILEEEAVLHLAMHTLTADPAGGSAAFLLKDEEDSIQDNRLHDYEINALALTSPMVVLSSCESGGGRLERGEGIMSLSRSFLLAGAESVVHTLWPVDDAMGPRLMVEFYRELKRGHSKSKSLSRAKKTFLASTPPTYAHPYYWAAYQVTGNPSSLVWNWKHIMIFGGILLFSLACYFFIRRSFLRRS
ncbi:MAG: CHAT domain-containing protein, partial [Bacteroidales bacterium]|nr:CHAT domain-containing protein [Bacteroidales bacterium]